MTKEFDAFLELCERIYLRMEQDGTWPWAVDEVEQTDSTLGCNLLDSEHCQ
jgi:hypothetical protein